MRSHSFLDGLNARSGRNPLCPALPGLAKSSTATGNVCTYTAYYLSTPNRSGPALPKPGERSVDAKLSVMIQRAMRSATALNT